MSAIAVVPKPKRKIKNCKAKGTRNEHKTIALLEAAGYQCMRAGASLGAWDVIGIGSTDIVLVQVKSTDWAGSVEMETLRNFVAPPFAKKLVHRWIDRKSKPDVREVS
jgi:Holliday junction resolvase